jgi:acetyltransferase-like isoleucine patch superfamily enzyme
MYRNKNILAFVISSIPLNFLRILLYRVLFKYNISFSAKIGLFTVIAVDKATIVKSNIGKFNRFTGAYTLEINEGSTIGDRNEFDCGEWVFKFEEFSFLRHCKIGKNTLITTLHFIDTAGGFELQDNSWIAGRQSQFWTHGVGATDRAISIGKGCYIGSNVNFAPGTSVGDNNLIGLGSVLTKKFNVENALIGGNPATIVRENYFWKERLEANSDVGQNISGIEA